MSKMLIQDDILPGMDVYVEYTIDPDEDCIILYDYGLELDNKTAIRYLDGTVEWKYNREHVSLRGYSNTVWMEEKLEAFIEDELTVEVGP